jgi:isochorismate synthase
MDKVVEKQISLKDLWSFVIENYGSVAVWRFPKENSVHFLGDLSLEPSKGRIDLQTTEMGFVVSPFMNPEGNETLFLKADVYAFTGSTGIWKLEKGDIAFRQAQGSIKYHLNHRPDTEISEKKNHFINMVETGIKAIEDGDFDKVVSARTYDEPLSENFNILDQFDRLEKAYTDAFVSLISIPGRGTWMGATPELLIESSYKHFRTVSVAGTQPFSLDEKLSEAAWNQKEIEEQAMVSRYIVDQFKTIRLREFEETGPRSVRAGNMIHLKTEYTVDLNDVNFPELGTIMLHLLHPTSAVCGMPKFSALRFIIAYEHLNREFYSGFLGPVNLKGLSRLYVNLRCMQILKTRAVLYAGAGITHDSVPDEEWDETLLKCQTLLNVMNRSDRKPRHG